MEIKKFMTANSRSSENLRAADLGLIFPGQSGAFNAITDVAGVTVGYKTVVEGEGRLVVGQGPIRTGITAILPRPVSEIFNPVFAGLFSLNGNGELTGSHYIEEVGKFSLPITITNTHACGIARDATISWAEKRSPKRLENSFLLPVSAETYDGFLNDINGSHVTAEYVEQAIDGAVSGKIDEGSVGGGTGMKSFGFKSGSGTASRMVKYDDAEYTVGIFVQANFGSRTDLTVLGAPVGMQLSEPKMVRNSNEASSSSIIVIIATDAPLLPHQLKRLARRATFGVGKTGGFARHGSGDIFLAFSTGSDSVNVHKLGKVQTTRYIPDEDLDDFFEAVIQATEESILNSLVSNKSMTGRDYNFVPKLPTDRLAEIINQFHRLIGTESKI
jgi:D-aminopeptidase